MCKIQKGTDRSGTVMMKKMIKGRKVIVWAIVIAMIAAMVIPLALSVI